ncbi:hypothetical protein HMPREF1992_01624 [Selenomonas sp. oral taxon 892 str. F0426]|nr:hypothetical protein HMPREF1992_01624 [Selenomonas sp. oral taxon 892 str. F0426]
MTRGRRCCGILWRCRFDMLFCILFRDFSNIISQSFQKINV